MIVVGCDFGLRKSGIVLLNDRAEIEPNLIRTNEKVKGAARLVEIETAFDSILSPYLSMDERVVVFLEGYAYGAKYQRESLAELGGVMRRYFFLKGLDYWVVPPTELKFFVTGTGKASKNYMKKCTKEIWDLSFKSDDVCDAHGIARLGMGVLNPYERAKLNEDHQQGVVDNIITHSEHYRNSNTARKKTTRAKKK